ncbi:hypothetical protein ES705_32169 [subsurface metagenome]
MPTLQVSDASMILLVKEARKIGATIKDVADTLVSEALDEESNGEDLEEEEEEE